MDVSLEALLVLIDNILVPVGHWSSSLTRNSSVALAVEHVAISSRHLLAIAGILIVGVVMALAGNQILSPVSLFVQTLLDQLRQIVWILLLSGELS